jgi:hypothetical protein
MVAWGIRFAHPTHSLTRLPHSRGAMRPSFPSNHPHSDKPLKPSYALHGANIAPDKMIRDAFDDLRCDVKVGASRSGLF